MNVDNDEQLMLKIKAGRVELLAIIFEKYNKQLFSYLYRITGSRQLSEDLVQEVFCRILKYKESYKGSSKFIHWIFRIARNTMFDHFRKHKKDDYQELEEHELPVDSTPEEFLESEEQKELLNRALMKLPERKREVIVLSRFQNLKYSEIAEILGCSENTIKVQVHRSLKELQKYMLQHKGA